MSRFETEILTTRKNLKSLVNVPGKWIDHVRQDGALDKLILDLTTSVSETRGIAHLKRDGTTIHRIRALLNDNVLWYVHLC